MLNKDQVLKQLKNHSAIKYADDQLYYQGDNVSILTAKSKRKPDNRIPIAFVNRLVKFIVLHGLHGGPPIMMSGADETLISPFERSAISVRPILFI